MLDLKDMAGENYSGINTADCVMGTLKDFEIADRIGYFTIDNASLNDTAVIEMHKLLQQEAMLSVHDDGDAR